MLSWAELNGMSRRLLKVGLESIEQHPRHLVMMGLLPRLDIKLIERLICERHPGMIIEGMALCDIVKKQYGDDAVCFIEQFALAIEIGEGR